MRKGPCLTMVPLGTGMARTQSAAAALEIGPGSLCVVAGLSSTSAAYPLPPGDMCFLADVSWWNRLLDASG
jgi:hypothetical protein